MTQSSADIEVVGPEAQVHLLGPHADQNVIGGAFLFERPDDLRTAELVARIKARVESTLDLAPRMRSVPVQLPGRNELHGLVDNQPVDLDAHIHVVAADTEVSQDRFYEIALSEMDIPLDLRRPLWSMSVVPRVEGGRAGVIFKVHHFIQDGVMGLASAVLLLVDTAPDAPLREAPVQVPDPWPDAEQLEHAAKSRPHPGRELMEKHWKTRPHVFLEHGRQMVKTYRTELAVKPSELLARRSNDRGVIVEQMPKAHIQACQNILGRHVSFNDVAVTLLIGGLRNLLADEDLSGQRLLVDVPVTLSLQDGSPNDFDKRAAMMVLSLPLDEPDLTKVLDEVNQQSSERKTTDAREMAALMEAISALPLSMFHKASARLWSRGNLLFSNIPGPPVDFYIAGNKVTQAFGMGQLRGHSALRVLAGSYQDLATWGIVYDRNVVDAQRLTQGLQDSLLELLAVGEAAGIAEAKDAAASYR